MSEPAADSGVRSTIHISRFKDPKRAPWYHFIKRKVVVPKLPKDELVAAEECAHDPARAQKEDAPANRARDPRALGLADGVAVSMSRVAVG